MIFEGEHSVIQAIREKKRLIETGQSHDHIRPLLIQGGGLMRGSYGAGAALALEEMGYTNVFSSLVGISSGAPIISYFAAGTMKEGIEAMLQGAADKKFINAWRFWNQVDTAHFIKILRSDMYTKLDVDRVFQNPADLYIAAAEYATAKPHLLLPKNEDHLFKAIHASINMQNVSPYKVIIDNVHYTDGGFSNPHAIGEAVKVTKPTHTLIVTNNDREYDPISRMERTLNRTIFRLRLNGVLAQAINTRREARDQAIAEVVESEVETAVVWGDGSISQVEQNPQKIRATIEASRTWWHGLFLLEEEGKT